MIMPWVLLAAPVLAAALWWGSWVWCAVAVVVAVVEYLALRQTERFSSRVWRTVGSGQRSRKARTSDGVYLVTVVAGLGLFGMALLDRLL